MVAKPANGLPQIVFRDGAEDLGSRSCSGGLFAAKNEPASPGTVLRAAYLQTHGHLRPFVSQWCKVVYDWFLLLGSTASNRLCLQRYSPRKICANINQSLTYATGAAQNSKKVKLPGKRNRCEGYEEECDRRPTKWPAAPWERTETVKYCRMGEPPPTEQEGEACPQPPTPELSP